jgi:hypothetical protein
VSTTVNLNVLQQPLTTSRHIHRWIHSSTFRNCRCYLLKAKFLFFYYHCLHTMLASSSPFNLGQGFERNPSAFGSGLQSSRTRQLYTKLPTCRQQNKATVPSPSHCPICNVLSHFLWVAQSVRRQVTGWVFDSWPGQILFSSSLVSRPALVAQPASLSNGYRGYSGRA